MPNLDLWIFSKREKSTAFPTTNPIRTEQCYLKDGVSMLTPSFILAYNSDAIRECNYARFMGKYYHIRDFKQLNATTLQVDCEEDILATWSNYVTGATVFVERAAQHYDEFVTDGYISQSYTGFTEYASKSLEPPDWDTNGTFVVRVVSGTTSKSSLGVMSYALNSTQLADLLSTAFSEGQYDFLSDSSVKSFFNPFQYIVSVQWFPFTASAFGGTSDRIKLGWWDTGVDGTPVLNTEISYTLESTPPPGKYVDFRRYDMRWTTVRAFFPGAGMFFLNPAEVMDGCFVRYNIDIATGECLIKLHPSTNSTAILGVYSGKMCSNIAIGQIDVNTGNIAKSLLTTAGSVLSGNVLGAAGGLISVAENVLQPTPSLNGSAGNMAALLDTSRIILTTIQSGTKDFATSSVGRPVMRNMPLNMFSGYVKCGNVSMLIPGTQTEREMLNSLMNGGFYIE